MEKAKGKKEAGKPKKLTVTIGGVTHPVVLPVDHATRWDLAMAFEHNTLRASAAALGVCVPALGLPSLSRYQYNVPVYGGECFGILSGRGIGPSDLAEPGSKIHLALLHLMLPSETEVKKAVDFT